MKFHRKHWNLAALANFNLKSDIPASTYPLVAGGLEHIPACTGWEAVHKINWSLIYKPAPETHSHSHLHLQSVKFMITNHNTSLMSNLLCLLSSKSQQVVSRARLQQRALTESNTAGPHWVHHFAATFTQVPQTDLHVPSLTAHQQIEQKLSPQNIILSQKSLVKRKSINFVVNI